MLEFLRRPVIIIICLVAAVALVFGFQAWIPSVGGSILDQVSTVDESAALLSSMSYVQKNSHFWMTLSLDYVFPITYGTVFAGLALRFPRRLGVALAIPAFLVVGADVLENTLQLMILKGHDGLLVTKSYVTPAKFFLFNVAAVVAGVSLIRLGFKTVYKRLKRKVLD